MSRARRLSAIVLLAAGMAAAPALPIASADPCPDVQLVFARGTGDPPGAGWLGDAFADSLRARTSRDVDVYPVDYPASLDFAAAADGVADASNHVREMAANCPGTKMVLGGYSQGAAVIGYVTAASIPPGYVLPPDIAGPMPANVARRVSAVALFGEPSARFLDAVGAPPIVIGPLYAGKTINQCIADDPVCTEDGGNLGAHRGYVDNGMVDQAADYVAGKL
jgi:cutinase